MSTKASLPPEVPIFSGNLIQSITELAIQSAESPGATEAPAAKRPTHLVHKQQDGRNYFRVTEIPAHAEMHCATADCDNSARLLLDSRDAEILPYCVPCAHVEFAMWMVGV